MIVGGPEAPAQAARRGTAARAHVPRSSHARLELDDTRRDPLRIIEAQAADRLPELVPLRHGRMAASPWAFFRGAAAVMAADLAHTPATGLRVQLCGDAHAGNFGGFAGPDRRMIFDLNDFDETLPGAWEWDLKRLVASVAVGGRERGLDRNRRTEAIGGAVREYQGAMRDFARMRTLDVWYAKLDVEQDVDRWAPELSKARRAKLDREIGKAEAKDNVRAFAKLAESVDGSPRIAAAPPLIVPLRDLLPNGERAEAEDRLLKLLAAYRDTLAPDREHLLDGYRPVDFARKVVGVGSVGTRDWIALLMGQGDDDPLFLQIKESTRSALEPFAGRSDFANEGRRVVEGQRLMQSASDILLGWLRDATTPGERPRDYYVRQLWNAKGTPPIDSMPARGLVDFARVCGWTLARAHARSGDRSAIAGYLGRGDHLERALVRFAEAYADRNERDHAALVAAVRSGRIAADPA
ncbi:MAG TPA: DUF2252 domain-containing protein [Solirubrobacteraceae bacterium]|nr:DUF2252 domain-containing protein [Solirubrobacteraceae bacterium]